MPIVMDGMNTRPTGSARPVPRLLECLFACCALFGSVAAASQPESRSFELPAGAAANSLRQFASQSGEEVIFMSEEVNGVTTKAVLGTMTRQEALDRLLDGTPLSSTRDQKSGTIAVSR